MGATVGGKLIVGARRALERVAGLEHAKPRPTPAPWAWFLEARLHPDPQRPQGGYLKAWAWGGVDFRHVERHLGPAGAKILRLSLAKPVGFDPPPPSAPLLLVTQEPKATEIVLSVDVEAGLPWPQDAAMIAAGREELVHAGAHLARTTEAIASYEALRVAVWSALENGELAGPAIPEIRAGLAFIAAKERRREARHPDEEEA